MTKWFKKIIFPLFRRLTLFRLLAVLTLVLISSCRLSAGNLTFDRLLVEYTEAPTNISQSHPRFSWIVTSEKRNQVQTAFRLLVSSSRASLASNRADLWDSGKKLSATTSNVIYHGKELASNQKYYWKVIIWDGKDQAFESPVTSFETSLFYDHEWKALWIGKGPADEPLPAKGFYGSVKEQAGLKDTVIHEGRSLLLRKEIACARKIKTAKAFITGLGFYEFYINGKRVGDLVLTPAKTPYHKHILYDTYDVTSLLKQGKNALGIHLGNGWYNPYKKWWNQYRMQWFGAKKAILQIHITYDDGSTEITGTDKSWSWSDGPALYNCIYDGEVYDANGQKRGWNTTDYNAGDWKPVTVYANVKAKLVSQQMPPIREISEIRPTEVQSPGTGIRVFDMGQNFTGWARIFLTGNKNTRVTMRFAEDIKPDGNIDVSSNENAGATAQYILSGEGTEVYEPSFTYFGFRYVEITSDKPFTLNEVTGRVVHSANTPVGNFECGNDLVNKIHKATVWSQKSNMLGYPMDCPQRDERLGWLGDAQVSADQAMFNFDMALFYQNWFRGIRDNQNEVTGDLPIISPQPYMPDEGIEWSSTYLIMLWQFYLNYGDENILREHYPAMNRYMEFLAGLSKNHILPQGWIGDWGSLVFGWKEGQPESVPSAFYILNARIMAKTAAVLGYDADKKKFDLLENDITKVYNQKYLNLQTGNYLAGSQMDNAFPLYLDIVPDTLRQKVLDNLVADIENTNHMHLTTGVLGTKYMPEALAINGRADIAWKLINQKSYPGWNQMMEKYTTVCEFWTLKQSKNHVMMGSIDAWFYKYVAGIQIDPAHPGFEKFIIKPVFPEGLSHASASTGTIKGRISVSWEKQNDHVLMNVHVPFSTSAMVYIPGKRDAEITEGGRNLKNIPEIRYHGYKDGLHEVEIPSGDYQFSFNQK